MRWCIGIYLSGIGCFIVPSSEFAAQQILIACCRRSDISERQAKEKYCEGDRRE